VNGDLEYSLYVCMYVCTYVCGLLFGDSDRHTLMNK
jgi:hypothetical protein